MVWEIPLVAHHKQRRVLWMMKRLGLAVAGTIVRCFQR
jgi:hypothetical protein